MHLAILRSEQIGERGFRIMTHISIEHCSRHLLRSNVVPYARVDLDLQEISQRLKRFNSCLDYDRHSKDLAQIGSNMFHPRAEARPHAVVPSPHSNPRRRSTPGLMTKLVTTRKRQNSRLFQNDILLQIHYYYYYF